MSRKPKEVTGRLHVYRFDRGHRYFVCENCKERMNVSAECLHRDAPVVKIKRKDQEAELELAHEGSER